MQPAASEAVGVFGENCGPAEPDPAVGMARPSWFPPLPRGYSEQAAWGFHDSAGLSYDFYRVYGPSEAGGGRGDLCRINEARSFWSVIWASFSATAGARVDGRWISFAQARDRLDGKLKFARFSSPLDMADVIPRWLQT